MSIENLTIAKAKQKLQEHKELQKLFNMSFNMSDPISEEISERNLYNRYIGKYVICRTRNEGINAGKVLELDETGVILEDARRMWYHKPINKDCCWYEGVAKYGPSDETQLSTPREKLICEDYSLTICSKEAEVIIRGLEDEKQS